jgi:cytochrome P450
VSGYETEKLKPGMTPPSPALAFTVATVLAALLLPLLRLLLLRARAASALRAAGLSAAFWRPRASLWRRPYGTSERNLLEAVRQRCAAAAGGRNAYGVVMGALPVVHVGCPELARAALAAGGSCKAPLYDAFKSFVGDDALFTSEGDAWRSQRAAVQRALASGGPASLAAAASAEAARLVQQLALGDGVEREVDLQPLLQRLTLRATFCYLTGGADAADVGPGEPACNAEGLLDAYLGAAAVLRAALPAKPRSAAWLLLPEPLYRRCTALGRAEAAAVVSSHALARRALALAGAASPLARALAGGEGDAAALHCAATLLFAGHDTQSATLAWAVLRLADAAGCELQAALRAEAVADPSCEKAGSPELLDAALRETLRLHPPAPLVMRALPRAASAGGELALPPSAAVAVWLHAVQRCPAAWGADSDEFRPGRWLAGGPGGRAMHAYMPFAAGARACPGAALAHAGLRAAMGELLRGMRWALPPQREGGGALQEGHLHPSTGFTVTPAGGVRVRVMAV